ncbi:hypothetical protein QP110_02855 [Aerococcus sp. UMB10185]|uniref:hypothetical protein n=1 Tax=unclassified Aerococcus TaxID=2618060 RepID=UPI0008A6524A|nr:MULTISPECIES: hypothetical protein [unclassified Aerococcus]KAB0647334.1 hypothetical protein F6I01_02960 [Aerococcus sanguinicola]MDK6233202.1 hypothetical protein [Aerococcus sp. UMB10185]MDK6804693.1 hypothetical protein [Aerococcus sp. UMB7834]MDK6856039.1 hypothetical protein [Aerococcus sp. UMB7533]MDK8502366.1 hypothetical protein [Aerococcus sp. UMB1112A]
MKKGQLSLATACLFLFACQAEPIPELNQAKVQAEPDEEIAQIFDLPLTSDPTIKARRYHFIDLQGTQENEPYIDYFQALRQVNQELTDLQLPSGKMQDLNLPCRYGG